MTNENTEARLTDDAAETKTDDVAEVADTSEELTESLEPVAETVAEVAEADASAQAEGAIERAVTDIGNAVEAETVSAIDEVAAAAVSETEEIVAVVDSDEGDAVSEVGETVDEAVKPIVAAATAADILQETSPTPADKTAQPKKSMVAKSVGELPANIANDFVAALEHTVLEFSEGDIVEGTVVNIDQNEVLIDIGYKSEGVIPGHELSIRNSVNPGDIVAIGDRIEALVLDKEDEDGRLILSKKRAQYERAWGRIEEITNEGRTVSGPVIEVVKGGLIVDIGLRGFLPASLVELRRVRDLDPYVGQEIEAKVIELDRNRNNVVLSRRAFLEEAQAEQRQAFLDDLAVGEVRDGVISSVVNFGAFVDLGGMDGLVHVSELSYQHVNHPSEVVKVGDKVTIKVLEVDLDRERISLSIKQTQEDPWVAFARQNEVGGVVEGAVTKTVPFGAFVSVGDGVEGLVHVSEIALHRVESPELELSIGQPVKVRITEMDDERRRVSLSIKQAMPEWQERSETSPPPPPSEPRRKAPERREFERESDREEEERSFNVDSSLEAILQELKERGIGRR